MARRVEDSRAILVIEENRALRSLLTTTLEDAGHTTLEASNGWSGLRMAEIHRPAVVLLGLRLPEVGPSQVLAAIHAREGRKPVAIVMGDHASALFEGARGLVQTLSIPVSIQE